MNICDHRDDVVAEVFSKKFYEIKSNFLVYSAKYHVANNHRKRNMSVGLKLKLLAEYKSYDDLKINCDSGSMQKIHEFT
jgi:hypothetical protein